MAAKKKDAKTHTDGKSADPAAGHGGDGAHGATDGNFMCHLAMLEGTGDGDGTTWLEPVTDEEYQLANKR